jgi:aminoglycoside phosphotransferase (APT) family kinase protein
VRPLRGVSSSVHVLSVSHTGRSYRVVLRSFVHAEWLTREPDLAVREATALRLLEGSPVPAPRLLGVDEDGSSAGVPCVLMTTLPGQVVLTPSEMEPWLERMADALPLIHAIRPSAGELPWTYAPYNDISQLDVPRWTSRPREWTKMLDIARGKPPTASEHLIHRDYHPANLLWSRGHISGVVDWVNACRGPAGVDIGHCRRNLALLHGVSVADRFLEHCLGWADYDPYWDLITLTDLLPDAGTYEGWTDLGILLTDRIVRTRADEYVVSLINRL